MNWILFMVGGTVLTLLGAACIVLAARDARRHLEQITVRQRREHIRQTLDLDHETWRH